MANNGKGRFSSNTGFIMAAVGSAVSLGNIWAFPYKMGANGGFAFLIIYIVMAIFIGYPLMLGEISLGRKTGKAAIGAYNEANPRFTVNGIIETIVPFFLLCFFCVLGGIILKYTTANFCDIVHLKWGLRNTDSKTYYDAFISDPKLTIIFMLIFIVATAIIVLRGVQRGIELFCSLAMPAVYIMLAIIAIRSCTLPGAVEGLKFMFKPDMSVFANMGWLKVFAVAGSQMFFSLSLASGALIAYGSYMRKEDNLERSAAWIPAFDTIAALLAGLAVLPAIYAMGIKPSQGTGMLFVSLQTVFDSMGFMGPIFGFIFYLLVFLAAFSSCIGLMEGFISTIMDRRIRMGKTVNRPFTVWIITMLTICGGVLVCVDKMGLNSSMWKPFGMESWLQVFDLSAEGLLMPLGGLLMAILLGWSRRGYLDDEIRIGSSYKSKWFVDICWRYIAPVFMLFILVYQFSSYFLSNMGWFQTLFG